jgi:hypothetical protein
MTIYIAWNISSEPQHVAGYSLVVSRQPAPSPTTPRNNRVQPGQYFLFTPGEIPPGEALRMSVLVEHGKLAVARTALPRKQDVRHLPGSFGVLSAAALSDVLSAAPPEPAAEDHEWSEESETEEASGEFVVELVFGDEPADEPGEEPEPAVEDETEPVVEPEPVVDESPEEEPAGSPFSVIDVDALLADEIEVPMGTLRDWGKLFDPPVKGTSKSDLANGILEALDASE